jgi:hypothetical protein
VELDPSIGLGSTKRFSWLKFFAEHKVGMKPTMISPLESMLEDQP